MLVSLMMIVSHACTYIVTFPYFKMIVIIYVPVHVFLVIIIPQHACGFPGCKSVIVIDGNMKNRCDVCAANEARFTEYEGLPGIIKTGCQLSPGYQSRYCHKHAGEPPQ